MRIQALVVGIASVLILTQPGSAALAATPPTSLSPHLGQYEYFSPIPGSRLVSPWNNIVIRNGSVIDRGTVDGRTLSVIGSASGVHTGRLTLLDDRKTVVFDPDQPFALGETVEVSLGAGVRTPGGEALPALSYSFEISQTDPRQQPAPALPALFGEMPTVPQTPVALPPISSFEKPASTPCDTLPAGYPATTLLSSNNPEPGDIFLAPFYAAINDAHLVIQDNFGMPVFYRLIKDGFGALDFKRQPNGSLTYFLGQTDRFYAMDSSYTVVDSFAAGNGYPTDLHELQLLPNGHALIMSYDLEPVDMSQIVPGGNPNAQVEGLILQELDAAKNVVFQWRSWDHFAITDLAAPEISLTGAVIDYVHGNAIELDGDGKLLLSSRHLNEITKIDRQTGDIIWRWGLNAVNNQFTQVADTRGFSHQHDIRRHSNGHVTLFDNGNNLSPIYSRALEYDLDETNKVATLVWEYRNTPDTFGGFMGNVQRLTSGGTLVGWGGNYGSPNVTDLHPDGSKAMELAFDNSSHTWWSYRAFRFPWKTNRFVADADSLEFGTVSVGSTATLLLTVRNNTTGLVKLGCAVSTDPAFSVPTGLPRTLGAGQGATFGVSFTPTNGAQHRATLYLRQVSETELVAQSVTLSGTGGGVAAVAGPANPQFGLGANRPNPFGRTTMIEFGVPRTEKVRLEILDIRGRLVERLVDGVRAAGRYGVPWNATRTPSGMYFCRLVAGGRTETRKIALMK